MGAQSLNIVDGPHHGWGYLDMAEATTTTPAKGRLNSVGLRGKKDQQLVCLA